MRAHRFGRRYATHQVMGLSASAIYIRPPQRYQLAMSSMIITAAPKKTTRACGTVLDASLMA
jgi:hypothetical protein